MSIHPAVYSAVLVDPIVSLLTEHTRPGGSVLDPFGGLGHRFAEIARQAELVPTAIEIEPGYFTRGDAHPCVVRGDSTSLPYENSSFDAAVTSPVYPSGMADNFRAKDQSVRHTYVHHLRSQLGVDYELHPNNTAGMNPRRSSAALAVFYGFHVQVWKEMFRLLRPGAPFVVNVKDTLKISFVDDTRKQLEQVGFRIESDTEVDTPGLNHGKNHERKNRHEHLLLAIR